MQVIQAGFPTRVIVEKVDFAIEANSFESLKIWEEVNEKRRLSWIQVNPGVMVEVGRMGEFPVCVELSWNIIEGRFVLFYHACSRVVDYKMVEDWITTHALNQGFSKADAMNAWNVIHDIKRKNEKEGKPVAVLPKAMFKEKLA